MSGSRVKKPAADRFWALVNKDGPIPSACPERGQCWIFTGSTAQTGGYGSFALPSGRRRGLIVKAHRYAHEQVIGPLAEGMDSLHHCDTPACCHASVDPSESHLYAGTDKSNAEDRVKRGRDANRSGSRNGRAKMTEEKVREIRRRHGAGEGRQTLAREFGLSVPGLDHIVDRLRWRNVPD